MFSISYVSASAEVITYDYDNAGQVKKVTYGQYATIDYVYDNSGNMTSKAIIILRPIITPAPGSLELGSVHISTPSGGQTVTITNTGTLDLVIQQAQITGTNASDFSKASDTCSNQTIQPNGTCQITVTMTPPSVGAKTASLVIPSNAPETPSLDIPLSGTGFATLTVVRAGTGAGSVSSLPIGIDCGSDCTENYSVPSVSLDASHPCSVFTGWSGACTGTGACSLTMDSDKSVTATFTAHIPDAEFTNTPAAIFLHQDINFYDQSTYCPTTWNWSFGDGTPNSTAQDPVHRYETLGIATVSLTATNTTGAGSISKVITVQCPNKKVRIVRGSTNIEYDSIQEAYNNTQSGDIIKVQLNIFTEDLNFALNNAVTIDGGYDCDFLNHPGGDTTVRGNVVDSNGSVHMQYIHISQ